MLYVLIHIYKVYSNHNQKCLKQLDYIKNSYMSYEFLIICMHKS